LASLSENSPHLRTESQDVGEHGSGPLRAPPRSVPASEALGRGKLTTCACAHEVRCAGSKLIGPCNGNLRGFAAFTRPAYGFSCLGAGRRRFHCLRSQPDFHKSSSHTRATSREACDQMLQPSLVVFTLGLTGTSGLAWSWAPRPTSIVRPPVPRATIHDQRPTWVVAPEQ
jgi:hypothetical protein